MLGVGEKILIHGKQDALIVGVSVRGNKNDFEVEKYKETKTVVVGFGKTEQRPERVLPEHNNKK